MTVELLWGVAPEPVPADPADPGLPATMADRLLHFIRNTTARAIVGVFAARTAALLSVIETIPPSFDLSTAAGEQLDRIGKILQRVRVDGETDDRYRLMLQIQVQLILSSTGATAPLLQIVLLYTSVEATHYQETHPAHIDIGALVPVVADVAQLLALLRLAKVGGVLLELEVYPAASVLLCDTVGGDVADPGTTDTVGGDEGSAAYPTTVTYA